MPYEKSESLISAIKNLLAQENLVHKVKLSLHFKKQGFSNINQSKVSRILTKFGLYALEILEWKLFIVYLMS